MTSILKIHMKKPSAFTVFDPPTVIAFPFDLYKETPEEAQQPSGVFLCLRIYADSTL